MKDLTISSQLSQRPGQQTISPQAARVIASSSPIVFINDIRAHSDRIGHTLNMALFAQTDRALLESARRRGADFFALAEDL